MRSSLPAWMAFRLALQLVALLGELGRVVGLLQLLDQRLDAREVVLRVLDAAHGERVAAVLLLVDHLQHAVARAARAARMLALARFLSLPSSTSIFRTTFSAVAQNFFTLPSSGSGTASVGVTAMVGFFA
jgi:hypothetical protein